MSQCVEDRDPARSLNPPSIHPTSSSASGRHGLVTSAPPPAVPPRPLARLTQLGRVCVPGVVPACAQPALPPPARSADSALAHARPSPRSDTRLGREAGHTVHMARGRRSGGRESRHGAQGSRQGRPPGESSAVASTRARLVSSTSSPGGDDELTPPTVVSAGVARLDEPSCLYSLFRWRGQHVCGPRRASADAGLVDRLHRRRDAQVRPSDLRLAEGSLRSPSRLSPN